MICEMRAFAGRRLSGQVLQGLHPPLQALVLAEVHCPLLPQLLLDALGNSLAHGGWIGLRVAGTAHAVHAAPDLCVLLRLVVAGVPVAFDATGVFDRFGDC